MRGFYRTVSLTLVLSLAAGIVPLAGQTTAGTVSTVPNIEFPQWSKDLRRAEIVAFGTLPFSWLVSTVTMDISRTIAHGGSQDYWPWPLKPTGAPTMTNSEFITTICVALGISTAVAIADHIIIKYKRKKAETLKLQNSQREPIIIRRPAADLDDETAATPNSETRGADTVPGTN
ncbi:MAG: hypothetical protein LBD44_03370 [Spirochaetaceae bacterium]|jgi:hypothetical protein|nr:hypothetical protein [Spirochaetaceae bacterium]